MSVTPKTDANRHDPVEYFDQGGKGLGQMEKTADGDWVPADLAEKLEKDAVELRVALKAILDAVDYTTGACRLVDMVGAALDKRLIENARKAIGGAE